MESISLQTVRPFVMDDMSLDEEMEEAGIEVKDKAGIQKLLRSRVSYVASSSVQRQRLMCIILLSLPGV